MSFNNVKTLKNVKGGLYRAINKKYNNNFEVDCCIKFKFIKKAQTASFNNKMNNLGITHLVLDDGNPNNPNDNGYNKTDLLMHDITIPITFGAPVVIAFIGFTRSGKSEGAQLVLLIYRKANKDYMNRDVNYYLCWTQPELKKALKKISDTKGDIVWVDEQSKTTGTGSRTEGWNIDNVLHAIAKKENCFLFATPQLKDIKSDICDLYLETAGQNRKTRVNRFMILDSNKEYFGHVYLKLHGDEKFREEYEKEKDEHIKKLTRDGGVVKAAQDDNEIIETEFEPHINGIDANIVKEILKEFESKATERDIELYIRRARGELLPALGRSYNVSNPSYYITKVDEFVKKQIKLKSTQENLNS